MKSKYTKVLAAAAILLAVSCVIFGGFWFRDNLVLVEGRLYPKKSGYLDLRGQEISLEQYEALRSALPGCEIRWDVPFQGGYQDSGTKQLSITAITEEELDLLACFPQLQTVNANGCRDYERLMKLQVMYPRLEVDYTVAVDGTEYPKDAVEIEAAHLTDQDVVNLAYLPDLSRINAEDCTDYAQLAAVRQAYPSCEMSYAVIIDGTPVDTGAAELTLQGMSGQEMADMLVHFPNARLLHLEDPVGEPGPLAAENPDITWDLTWNGVPVSSGGEELDLSGITLDGIEDVQTILAYMPGTKQVYLGTPDIGNDVIAAFREERRADCKVVWTVMCGEIPVRTDAAYFHPIQENVFYFYDEDCVNLKYCEDMICVDMGHMSVTHCDWVRYMPKLKYLILGVCGQLKDISALATCKGLVFLELELTSVRDFTPLLECTALEDLNLGYTYGDPDIIAQMTWLKNLWWSDCHANARNMLREALPDTFIQFGAENSTSKGWRKLENYYDMRDVLGMHYMN